MTFHFVTQSIIRVYVVYKYDFTISQKWLLNNIVDGLRKFKECECDNRNSCIIWNNILKFQLITLFKFFNSKAINQFVCKVTPTIVYLWNLLSNLPRFGTKLHIYIVQLKGNHKIILITFIVSRNSPYQNRKLGIANHLQ